MESSLSIISLQGKDASGNSSKKTLSPVIFPANDLPERIQSLQRQTMPADQVPMTLKQIEQAVGE
jgi:hypothetical protein